jgi:hypothetical protein
MGSANLPTVPAEMVIPGSETDEIEERTGRHEIDDVYDDAVRATVPCSIDDILSRGEGFSACLGQ